MERTANWRRRHWGKTIQIDQIRTLEERVSTAVELIRKLRHENKTLTDALVKSQQKLKELEALIGEFRVDQEEIERVLLRTLRNLDHIEDDLIAAEIEDAPAMAAAELSGPSESDPQTDEFSETSNHGDGDSTGGVESDRETMADNPSSVDEEDEQNRETF